MERPAVSATDPRRNTARGYDMQYHGTAEFRGADCPVSTYYDRGRFGRLFPLLPASSPEPTSLMKLGEAGGLMDGKDGPPGPPNPNNPDHPKKLPAGFTFLGQFIDHDITFDPTSSLERQIDPEAVANFRTPSFELDNVYGSGPGASPHLYQRGANRDKLLLGKDTGGAETDLPRNSIGTALIGDPRNDENLIVSQLHVAFLKFHNAAVDYVGGAVPPGRSAFEEAQRLVRWHYQWMILHEFLPAIVGQKTVDDVLKHGRKLYKWRNEPFIPVEFSVAAYRFGHSMVRPGYAISKDFARGLFPVPPPPGAPPAPPPAGDLPGSLVGGSQIKPQQVMEWDRFFALNGANLQVAKQFDPRISTPLHHLPFAQGTINDPKSLAQRNLLRGRTFRLPSGQAVARAVARVCKGAGCEPLSPDELSELAPLGLEKATPLWYYVLREAEIRAEGATLGPVGGRIVAEVFLGILEGDPLSYLRTDPDWTPIFGKNRNFAMTDLLKFAGVAQ